MMGFVKTNLRAKKFRVIGGFEEMTSSSSEPSERYPLSARTIGRIDGKLTHSRSPSFDPDRIPKTCAYIDELVSKGDFGSCLTILKMFLSFPKDTLDSISQILSFQRLLSLLRENFTKLGSSGKIASTIVISSIMNANIPISQSMIDSFTSLFFQTLSRSSTVPVTLAICDCLLTIFQSNQGQDMSTIHNHIYHALNTTVDLSSLVSLQRILINHPDLHLNIFLFPIIIPTTFDDCHSFNLKMNVLTILTNRGQQHHTENRNLIEPKNFTCNCNSCLLSMGTYALTLPGDDCIALALSSPNSGIWMYIYQALREMECGVLSEKFKKKLVSSVHLKDSVWYISTVLQLFRCCKRDTDWLEQLAAEILRQCALSKEPQIDEQFALLCVLAGNVKLDKYHSAVNLYRSDLWRDVPVRMQPKEVVNNVVSNKVVVEDGRPASTRSYLDQDLDSFFSSPAETMKIQSPSKFCGLDSITRFDQRMHVAFAELKGICSFKNSMRQPNFQGVKSEISGGKILPISDLRRIYQLDS